MNSFWWQTDGMTLKKIPPALRQLHWSYRWGFPFFFSEKVVEVKDLREFIGFEKRLLRGDLMVVWWWFSSFLCFVFWAPFGVQQELINYRRDPDQKYRRCALFTSLQPDGMFEYLDVLVFSGIQASTQQPGLHLPTKYSRLDFVCGETEIICKNHRSSWLKWICWKSSDHKADFDIILGASAAPEGFPTSTNPHIHGYNFFFGWSVTQFLMVTHTHTFFALKSSPLMVRP